MEEALVQELRQFVTDTFMLGAGGITLTSTVSLVESGILDSAGVLELVSFLEQRYGVLVADTDIVLANFNNLEGIARFVVKKRTEAACVRERTI
jgi:acyl carrier protein